MAEERAGFGLTHSTADQVEARTFGSGSFDLLGAHVCNGLEAEEHDFAFEGAAELAGVFIVGVEKSGARAGQGFDQLILGARNAGDRFEIFEMYWGDVGDDSLIWQRNAREGGNLAGVRHPHFDYGEIVLGLEREQAEGESEMIVEIAFCAADAVLDRKQMSDGLFGGGLAT